MEYGKRLSILFFLLLGFGTHSSSASEQPVEGGRSVNEVVKFLGKGIIAAQIAHFALSYTENDGKNLLNPLVYLSDGQALSTIYFGAIGLRNFWNAILAQWRVFRVREAQRMAATTHQNFFSAAHLNVGESAMAMAGGFPVSAFSDFSQLRREQAFVENDQQDVPQNNQQASPAFKAPLDEEFNFEEMYRMVKALCSSSYYNREIAPQLKNFVLDEATKLGCSHISSFVSKRLLPYVIPPLIPYAHTNSLLSTSAAGLAGYVVYKSSFSDYLEDERLKRSNKESRPTRIAKKMAYQQARNLLVALGRPAFSYDSPTIMNGTIEAVAAGLGVTRGLLKNTAPSSLGISEKTHSFIVDSVL